MTRPTLTVRLLRPTERRTACQVAGAAFAGNPSTLVNAHGDRGRAQRIIETVTRRLKLGRRLGRVLVAEHDGELVGMLNAVRSPGCQLRPREQLWAAPALLVSLRSALPSLMRMAAARALHDPAEPHWHIGPIGVRPDMQGRGVGSALLARFLQDADGDGTPAFLETDVDQNVRLYERFGFRIVDRACILGIETIFMRRPVGNPPHAS